MTAPDTAALALLRELEWSGPFDQRLTPRCPICRSWKDDGNGHKPDCRLAAALSSASSPHDQDGVGAPHIVKVPFHPTAAMKVAGARVNNMGHDFAHEVWAQMMAARPVLRATPPSPSDTRPIAAGGGKPDAVTVTNEMVERGSRAVCKLQGLDPDALVDDGHYTRPTSYPAWQDYVEDTKVALLAALNLAPRTAAGGPTS